MGQEITAVRVYLEQNEESSKSKNVLVKYKIEVPGQDLWIEVAGYDFYDAIVDAVDAATRKLRRSKKTIGTLF